MMLPTLQSMTTPDAPAVAPRNAAAQDSAGAPGFAQCLDHARDSAPGDDTLPPGDKAADASHAPAKKTARTRTALPDTVQARPGATVEVKLAPQAQPHAFESDPDGNDSERSPAETPSPDIAALLPGWPPAREVREVPVAKGVDSAPATAGVSMRSSPRPPLEATPSAPSASAAAAALTPQSAKAALAPDAAPAAVTPPAALRVRDLEPTFVVAAPVPPARAPAASIATAAPLPIAHVNAPLDTPAFAPALAAQVRWLVQDGVQQAQLTLNPAEMGPVAVQIVIDGRDARIDFTADFAATRTAIEASLPVLAAALDDSGLKLSGGGVHDGSRSAQHGQQGSGSRGSMQRNPDAGTTAHVERAVQDSAARGLVDLIA